MPRMTLRLLRLTKQTILSLHSRLLFSPPCPRHIPLDMSSSSDTLPGVQSHALFDILVHHQLYAEIESFKYPEAIDNYGYPFRKDDGVQTTSPLLQNMINKFLLQLPGLN